MRDGSARPQLHLTPEDGWLNDPLGLTYHAGTYHLFVQYLPGRTTWGPGCHWGHATSDDLLGWTWKPVALSPGEGDDGCWSGSIARPDDGEAVLFYTSVHLGHLDAGQVRTARPVDASWTVWAKGDVVATGPDDVDVLIHRDPYVYRDSDRWRMLVGAALPDGTATALVYASDDLSSWAYEGELAQRHTSQVDPWSGDGWECPQLFRLGDRWVLVVSVWEASAIHGVVYAVGDYADGRFTPERWDRFVHGPSAYAASAFLDADGRRGLVCWLRDVADLEDGWAGAVSLPWVLRLDGARVVVEPHPNLAARRQSPQEVRPGQVATLPALVELVWAPGGEPSTLTLSGSSALHLSLAEGILTARTVDGTWAMPMAESPVRIVVDGPTVELFSGGRVMPLVVPSGPEVSVTSSTGTVTAYPLGSRPDA